MTIPTSPTPEQPPSAEQIKPTMTEPTTQGPIDAEAIDAYLALIAQYGDPAMDMGHWSDFVNRVRRLAKSRQPDLEAIAKLRGALFRTTGSLGLVIRGAKSNAPGHQCNYDAAKLILEATERYDELPESASAASPKEEGK